MRIDLFWKIKRFWKKIKNIYRWLPVIYRDQDWDHWFTYEILKTKLKHQEKYFFFNGHLENAGEVVRQLRKCIYLIDMVQNEKYMDDCFNSDKWDEKDMDTCIENHDKARKELFQSIERNIESWWD